MTQGFRWSLAAAGGAGVKVLQSCCCWHVLFDVLRMLRQDAGHHLVGHNQDIGMTTGHQEVHLATYDA